jgi:predicted PurR-regulated permease PerM
MNSKASEADMQRTATTGHHENRYPIAETLWVLAGVILMLAFGDALALLVIALALVAVAAAWWIHRTVEHRGKGHALAVLGPFILAGAALATVLMLAAPAQAATINNRFDICGALRGGTSLATIESTLENGGYSATNAGTLTGTTIRQQCPDQAAGVMAQLSSQRG